MADIDGRDVCADKAELELQVSFVSFASQLFF